MMRNPLSLLLALSLLAFSCQNGQPDRDQEGQEQDGMNPTADSSSMRYTLTPVGSSPEYPGASLQFNGYQNGQFDFQVDGFDLKAQTQDAEQKMCANSAEGQHIHLIIDTLPYVAKYEPDFAHEISDGEHYVLAFLSRSYHESLKNNDVFILQKGAVSNNSLSGATEVREPMLFYSRPKGTYVGQEETNRVLLDFYLVNVNLGSEYRVLAEINGEKHIIETWEPYYIEGLPMGENTITLTLTDGEGRPVENPLNPVTRVFELREDPAEGR